MAFKRMVLGLPHSAKDYGSVAFTAEFADLLGLDLVGLFTEDERLGDLALLPCVREFRFYSDGWHRMDAKELEQSVSQAAADARRLFDEAARQLRGGRHVEFVKRQIGAAMTLSAMPNDIIAVIEPKNPAERVTHQFRTFMEMAIRAPTAALLVPSRINRRKGPVVAIAGNEYDASIQVGLRVAEATGEKLVVLTPKITGETLSDRSAPTRSVQYDQRLPSTREVGIAELTSALAVASERFLVMSRGSDNLIPFQLASERGVPVLVTARNEPSSDPVS